MADGWTAPSTILSAMAFAVSAASFLVSWRTHKRQETSSDPAVTCKVEESRDGPGWYEVTVQVINRSDYRWLISGFEVRRPKGMRAISEWDVLGIGPHAPKPIETAELKAVTGKIPLRVEVQSVGTPRTMLSQGDTAYHHIWLKVGQIERDLKLSMRVDLTSMEPSERVMRFQISRTIRPPSAQPSAIGVT